MSTSVIAKEKLKQYVQKTASRTNKKYQSIHNYPPSIALSIQVKQEGRTTGIMNPSYLSNSVARKLNDLMTSPMSNLLLNKTLHMSMVYKSADKQKQNWIKSIEASGSNLQISAQDLYRLYDSCLTDRNGPKKDIKFYVNEAEKLKIASQNSLILSRVNELEEKKERLKKIKKEYSDLTNTSNREPSFILKSELSIPKSEIFLGDTKVKDNNKFTQSKFDIQLSSDSIKGSLSKSFSKKSDMFRQSTPQSEPLILVLLKKAIGIQLVNYLRDLYEKYSLTPTHNLITYNNFQKFLTDYSVEVKKEYIELFRKNNKTEKINFMKFIEILFIISSNTYPDILSKECAIDHFIRTILIPKEKDPIPSMEFETQYKKWVAHIESKEVSNYLKAKENFFTKLFDTYKVISADSGYHINFSNFLKMCTSTKICPYLISNRESEKIFKISQKGKGKTIPDDCLSYDNFITSICLIALYYYSKKKDKTIEEPTLQKIQRVINYINA